MSSANYVEAAARAYLNRLEAIQIPYEDKEEIKYFVQAALAESRRQGDLNPAVISTAISKVKESTIFGGSSADFVDLAVRLITELQTSV